MLFFSGKKILVTGAAGFIGAHLLARLLTAGARVRAAIHRRESSVLDERVEYIRGDLTLMTDCRRVASGVDMVFHCAASTSGAAVIERTPMVHVTPNIVMNAQLLEAAYQAGVKKFLWISSSTGYPDTGAWAVSEPEMMQGDPYEKYYHVGWMKRYSEILCRTYGEKIHPLMTTVVLRPTNIYGEHDDFDPRTSHVFAALIRKVAERQDPLEVWGTGEDVRDLVYIQDFIDAMLTAMEKVEGYDVFNIGLGEGYAVKDLLNRMLAVEGYTPRIICDPSKPTTIPVRRVDISKARKTLGFSPGVGIDEGIRRTLAWYKKFEIN
ncbi:MAG: NAD-dependent epimerase/dehydratase family protein [Candidatus Omnitrophota bacterium]